jgi:hypothetical protein
MSRTLSRETVVGGARMVLFALVIGGGWSSSRGEATTQPVATTAPSHSTTAPTTQSCPAGGAAQWADLSLEDLMNIQVVGDRR